MTPLPPALPEIVDRIRAARRVCFFAHHDIDDVVDRYVLYYLQAIADAGFEIIFVTTSLLSADERAKLNGLCAEVIIRDNVGLDFGGWAECLSRYPDLSADLLLLCNDSVYGPFWCLSDFINDLTAEPADFYGAVLSLDEAPKPYHLQSWFLIFRPPAYGSRAFRTIFSPVPATLSKLEIIERYELQLTDKLEGEGLTFRAAFDPRTRGRLLAREPVNAAYVLWDELVTRRLVPFLKIGLIRDKPAYIRGLHRWYAVGRALNECAADLALSNLERRIRARHAVPFERARDLAFAMVGQTTYLPIAKPLLVADMSGFEHRKRGGLITPSVGYGLIKITHGLIRRPYRFVYDAVSRWRRRPHG